MMLLLALRDEKTGTYLAPIVSNTPGEAERTYMEILTAPGTIVSKHPRDFPLYEIGAYDEKSGLVVPIDGAPRLLVTAGQLGIGGVKPVVENLVDPAQLKLLPKEGDR